uniref:Uncharacterized protein n=1 Tax=Octopus bimaculoides TaxID=37653 RepID=A0A0L8FX77_OCTBM
MFKCPIAYLNTIVMYVTPIIYLFQCSNVYTYSCFIVYLYKYMSLNVLLCRRIILPIFYYELIYIA